MVTVLSEKLVTARKGHRCQTCSGPAIEPGETYNRQAVLADGRVYTWVTCEPCRNLLDVVWDWAGHPWDEGVGMDSYDEWAREFHDHPELGPAAVAYLTRRGAEGMGAVAWRDAHGDIWRRGADGLMHTPETAPFELRHVQRKWGPLTPVPQGTTSAQLPIGTPVRAYPGLRPEDSPTARVLETVTRTKPELLGGHTRVVWVEGHASCIALTHIDLREPA